MPKRSHEVLQLSENVTVLDLIRREKELYARVTKICSKNKSIHKIVKREQGIYATFGLFSEVLPKGQ